MPGGDAASSQLTPLTRQLVWETWKRMDVLPALTSAHGGNNGDLPVMVAWRQAHTCKQGRRVPALGKTADLC